MVCKKYDLGFNIPNIPEIEYSFRIRILNQHDYYTTAVFSDNIIFIAKNTF